MSAEYFDGWYADLARSEARQALFTELVDVACGRAGASEMCRGLRPGSRDRAG